MGMYAYRGIQKELAWAIDKWLWLYVINTMLFETVIPLRI